MKVFFRLHKKATTSSASSNDATILVLYLLNEGCVPSRSESCLYGTRTGLAESTVAFGPN